MLAGVLATVFLAQTPQIISEVRVEQEGRVVNDRVLNSLIETTAGEPLSMREVRDTLAHLTSLNRFEDVQVFQEPAGDGLRLRYVLFPFHPVDRMDFRGTLGLSEDELRRVFTERFGAAPAAGRAEEIADALRTYYRDRGYASAQVTPRIEETHNPDRATMGFEISAGSRAVIGRCATLPSYCVILLAPRLLTSSIRSTECSGRKLRLTSSNSDLMRSSVGSSTTPARSPNTSSSISTNPRMPPWLTLRAYTS